MPSYLRFTPLTSGCRRETTTHRAVRARWTRLRWSPRPPDGLAAVDEPDARPVLRRREGERPAAHGFPVGHGARPRQRLDEVGRAAPTAARHPALPRARGLPRHRGPAARSGHPEPALIPDRAAAGDRVQLRIPRRPRA